MKTSNTRRAWTVEKDLQVGWNVIDKSIDEIIGFTYSKSNAKRIVQAVNSHDDLLEALKILYEAVANSEHQLSSRGNGAIGKIAKQAIAKAEES